MSKIRSQSKSAIFGQPLAKFSREKWLDKSKLDRNNLRLVLAVFSAVKNCNLR